MTPRLTELAAGCIQAILVLRGMPCRFQGFSLVFLEGHGESARFRILEAKRQKLNEMR